MIIFTREEAQQILNAVEYPGPSWFEARKPAAELIRAKLSELPKNQIRPHEFLKAVEGKEEFVGMPIIWAEWPTKENNDG